MYGNTVFQTNGIDDIRILWYAEIKRSRLNELGEETNIFINAIDC